MAIVSNNLFATLANDDPSDGLGGSGQDIVSLKASYSENQHILLNLMEVVVAKVDFLVLGIYM